MRRNTVTVIKYLVFAAVFLTLGPFTLRMIFGERSEDGVKRRQFDHPIGLPEAPDVVRLQHDEVLKTSRAPVKVQIFDMNQLNGGDVNKKIVQGNPLPPQQTGKGRKIDWHDYKKIAEDEARTGPGEQGAAVILSADDESKKDSLYKVNGFNAYASDKISLDRALKDIRHPDCKKKQYLDKLPNVSIIVPFHNEHWSTLLRTAVSSLNRSPDHLIHEIILVDDFSSKDHCKKPLDDHLATHYGGKVKVVHQEKREGLIRTRITGARHATGEVLIFLDSHCEANINWLPPLLEPIAEDYRTVVCPFIDVIDFENFAYRAQDEGARGAFDWEFFYKRLPLLPEDLKHPAEPFKSPVMAGGLFAISAKWFWELGGYDPGLDIWGGEQYELSFKLWQCGGQMVDVPCSRVGHVYRKFNPFGAPGRGDYTGKLWQCGGMMVDAPCSRVGHIYRKFAPFPNPGVGDFVGRNYRRVAETWMDEYAEYLYLRRPHYRNIDTGDLSEQRAIRKKLNCKSFKWFMTEVAFDLPLKYPPVEPPSVAEGELRNVGANMCVDTRFKGQNERFQLEQCIKDHPGAGGEQRSFHLRHTHDVRVGKRNLCFDFTPSGAPHGAVILFKCHGSRGHQWWKYNVAIELSWHKDLRPRKRTFCFDVSTSINKAPVILYNCHGMRGNQWWKYNVDTKQLFHPVSAQCLDGDGGSKEIFMSRCDIASASQRWQFEKVNATLARQEWEFKE